MKNRLEIHTLRLIMLCCITILPLTIAAQTGPQPGDIYKEYSVNLKTGNNWRVTDPNAGNEGAQDFLPNPVLSIDIEDLEGAVRAEAQMDIWGGHTGTTDKQFRFNGGSWIDIPNLTTTPEGHEPECYMAEYNAIVDLPLQHLVEGGNTFEGTSGPQICYNFNWGQWGWYVMIVRVYYGSEKEHTAATINNPGQGSVIHENPDLSITSDQLENIVEVQYLGKYLGYDENGDGIYDDWHQSYHSNKLEGHIGTATSSPFNVTWNTEWVPDQEPESVSLMARVRDKNGVWYVTEAVDNLTFQRAAGTSVKMYTARDVPERFWVRAGRKMGCFVDVTTLTDAVSARIFHRTWNAGDDNVAGGTFSRPLFFNNQMFKCYGKNHFYALSSVNVPVSTVKEGANDVSYRSSTEHHGIEILWPGPAILIQYNAAAEKVANPVFNPPSGHTFKDPFNAQITCETEGAVIYYSLDRYDPNQSGLKYNSGINVSGDVTIKAMAFKEGMLESNLVEATYTMDTTTTDTSTIGLQHYNTNNGITIYPNPTSGILVIEYQHQFDFDNIQLFSSEGKLMLDAIEANNTVDVSNFSPGMYYLLFTGKDKLELEKILVN